VTVVDSQSPSSAGAAASSRSSPAGITLGSSTGSVTVQGATDASSGSAAEINVIGMTVERATELVDKFLDDAALAHRLNVRIIHGHGTGALRRGLGEFLRNHPLVDRVASEHPDRGGNAITVVELRS